MKTLVVAGRNLAPIVNKSPACDLTNLDNLVRRLSEDPSSVSVIMLHQDAFTTDDGRKEALRRIRYNAPGVPVYFFRLRLA